MRIESYTQVQQLYNANKATKVQGRAKASVSDQIHISSIGKDIQTGSSRRYQGRTDSSSQSKHCEWDLPGERRELCREADEEVRRD